MHYKHLLRNVSTLRPYPIIDDVFLLREWAFEVLKIMMPSVADSHLQLLASRIPAPPSVFCLVPFRIGRYMATRRDGGSFPPYGQTYHDRNKLFDPERKQQNYFKLKL